MNEKNLFEIQFKYFLLNSIDLLLPPYTEFNNLPLGKEILFYILQLSND